LSELRNANCKQVGSAVCKTVYILRGSGGAKVGPDGARAPAVKHCAQAVHRQLNAMTLTINDMWQTDGQTGTARRHKPRFGAYRSAAKIRFRN